MTDAGAYNPLDLEALGDSLLRELERQRLFQLASVERFRGSGIYALYYQGNSEPYELLGEFNRDHGCRVPIYIGRAKDTGGRRGLSPFEPVTGSLLWERVNHHKRSIESATSLSVEDFAVRALVVMPIWIPLAEAMAIRRYKPLWNSHLQGFGIHAPGSGRSEQKRSEWDELHPGRGFAGALKRNESATRQALLERLREASRVSVEGLLASMPPQDRAELIEQQPPPASPAPRSRSGASPRPKRR